MHNRVLFYLSIPAGCLVKPHGLSTRSPPAVCWCVLLWLCLACMHARHRLLCCACRVPTCSMSVMKACHTAGLRRPLSCGGTTAALCFSWISRFAPEPAGQHRWGNARNGYPTATPLFLPMGCHWRPAQPCMQFLCVIPVLRNSTTTLWGFSAQGAAMMVWPVACVWNVLGPSPPVPKQKTL